MNDILCSKFFQVSELPGLWMWSLSIFSFVLFGSERNATCLCNPSALGHCCYHIFILFFIFFFRLVCTWSFLYMGIASRWLPICSLHCNSHHFIYVSFFKSFFPLFHEIFPLKIILHISSLLSLGLQFLSLQGSYLNDHPCFHGNRFHKLLKIFK